MNQPEQARVATAANSAPCAQREGIEGMAMTDANGWQKICALEDIPLLGARVVKSAHGNIAVFRAADDVVFALADKCPHKGGPLSQGIVFGHKVACPLHGWNIGLKDGNAVAPDKGCTKRYPVRVDAGMVFLQITASLPQ